MMVVTHNQVRGANVQTVGRTMRIHCPAKALPA